MQDGDNEDLWLACLAHAVAALGDGLYPKQYAAFATKLYAAAKAATAKDADAKPKSIVQLKQV